VIRGDTAASVALLRLSESCVIAVNYRYSMRFYITALSTLLKEKEQPFAQRVSRIKSLSFTRAIGILTFYSPIPYVRVENWRIDS